MEYELECINGHSCFVDATELESLIDDGDSVCEECGAELELAEEVILECQDCSEEYDVRTLEEARAARDSQCGHCAKNWFDSDFYVPGSRGDKMAEYEWVRNGANPERLQRRGREDYWEGVIHFCNRQEFISVFEEQTIRANPTRATGSALKI